MTPGTGGVPPAPRPPGPARPWYATAGTAALAAIVMLALHTDAAITRRRWRTAGGDPSLVGDVAAWAVPAAIIGGRIYFDLTTPADIPRHWWGVFAVWSGGLGIWGAVALAAVVGAWRVRRRGADVKLFMDAVAPALLVAQAIGRIGNYFNQELGCRGC